MSRSLATSYACSSVFRHSTQAHPSQWRPARYSCNTRDGRGPTRELGLLHMQRLLHPLSSLIGSVGSSVLVLTPPEACHPQNMAAGVRDLQSYTALNYNNLLEKTYRRLTMSNGKLSRTFVSKPPTGFAERTLRFELSESRGETLSLSSSGELALKTFIVDTQGLRLVYILARGCRGHPQTGAGHTSAATAPNVAHT